MSKNFEKVKQYYGKGLWSLERVKLAVGKWITAKEFYEITGEEYEEITETETEEIDNEQQ